MQTNWQTVWGAHLLETYTPILRAAGQKLVMQQAINVLTMREKVLTDRIFTPNTLMEF